MQSKLDITISPIFNQSIGGVWSDFARIEMCCDEEVCGFKINDADRQRIYDRNIEEWESQKYTFAFGAYDGKKMVGFASGYRESKQGMYLHNLYVLPKYEGKGIGKSLLEQCERNAALITNKMTLVSLFDALGFYEKYGYSVRDKRKGEKKLPKEFVGVVPVFKSIGWLRNVKFNLDVDISDLDQYKNQPMFAYVSLGREIDGLGIKTSNGEDKIWTNPKKSGMKDFYERRLLSALAKVR